MADKIDKAVKVGKAIKEITHKPNRFVDIVQALSELITSHGMAPAAFACGVLFGFMSVFKVGGLTPFNSYGGYALGVGLILLGVVLHVWRLGREHPKQLPSPTPVDPEVRKDLALMRRIVAKVADLPDADEEFPSDSADVPSDSED